MKPVISHPWDLSQNEALLLQQKLATKVVREDKFGDIQLIAGVDVAYEKEGDKLVAAVVILDADTLNIVETATATDVAQFPYIPGLFSFRELPPLILAMSKLEHQPDLIVCDGQGIAHPRRLGLASHLGVIFDMPTIGCGKTKLIGQHDTPDIKRGAVTPLIDKDEVIGSVLRTQQGINPIYVSIGNQISLSTANEWVLKLSPKYRLPETTRSADQAVRVKLSKITS
ncbi:deoxyribonuclease V [Agaribacter flavus]|uniref:Endonuclease V n=1 Tax=Agaribacter flavus TaxID=1902781 RepID=A0ABV7FNG1_9ALTE